MCLAKKKQKGTHMYHAYQYKHRYTTIGFYIYIYILVVIVFEQLNLCRPFHDNCSYHQAKTPISF